MTKMRFEIRKDVHDTVDLLQRMLAKNFNENYAAGFMRATIVDAIMDLPPAKRDHHLRVLRRSLSIELENTKDVA